MQRRPRAPLVRRVFQGTVLLGTIVACSEPTPPPVDGGAPVCAEDEVGVCASPCPAGAEQQSDGTCEVPPVDVTSGCPAGSTISPTTSACVTERVPVVTACSGTSTSVGCIVAAEVTPGCPAGTVSDYDADLCMSPVVCRGSGTSPDDPLTTTSWCHVGPSLVLDDPCGSGAPELQAAATIEWFVVANNIGGYCAFRPPPVSGSASACDGTSATYSPATGLCVKPELVIPIECPAGYQADLSGGLVFGLPYGSGDTCPTSADCSTCGSSGEPTTCAAHWTGTWTCIGQPVCPSGTFDIGVSGVALCVVSDATPQRTVCPSGSFQSGSACVIPFATACPSGSTEMNGECVVPGAIVQQCPPGTTGTPGDCRTPARECPPHTFPDADGQCRSPVTACPPDTFDTGQTCAAACEGTSVATCIATWPD